MNRGTTGAGTLSTPAELAAALGWHRVLAFGAHPDDLDFGAAGTMAGLTRAGVEVTYCVMTDGDAGGFDTGDHHTITGRRQQEQRDAAAHLGVRDVEFLGERDGYLEPSHGVIAQVVALMRRHRPDAVFTMHPERDWDRLQRSHPDHLAAGEAVVRAAYPAVENPFAYPELAEQGLEAFRLPWLVLYGGPSARTNLVVDVTGAEQDKLQALRHHVSQHPDVPRMEQFVLDAMAGLHRDWSPDAAGGEDPRGGEDAGSGPGEITLPGSSGTRYAEGFHLVAVNDPSTISGF